MIPNKRKPKSAFTKNIRVRELNRDSANKVAKRKIEPKRHQVRQPEIEFDDSSEFDRSVIFKQSQIWSRGIIWTILGVTSGLAAWACFAPLEEAVPATGKLEPVGKVQDIQVPVGGVVKQVLIKDGDKVIAGQKLLSLESTVPQAQLASLQTNLASMTAEAKFYRSLLGQGSAETNSPQLAKLTVRPEIFALTKNRSSIVAENQLYRAELNGTKLANLTTEQNQRLQSSRTELSSRMSSGRLDIDQANNQLWENRNKRSGINNLLITARSVIANIQAKAKARELQIAAQIAENRTSLKNSQALLASNQGVLDSMQPAVKAGALSRNQVIKQQEEVTTRSSEVAQSEDRYHKLVQDRQEIQANSRLEIQNQQQQIKQYQNEISQLDREYNRLGMVSNQSRVKLTNSLAISRKDLLDKIATNDKQIAEIDGQLNKLIVEIDRKIADLNSQIAQAKMNLKYQDIIAPVSGTVFELKAGTPGFVANTSEPVLKIVPDDTLTAKVFITNKDIGFVKVGMPVDVRVESFPFSEYGDVKGKIVEIGSDALPADQNYPFDRFPATIRLEQQNLNSKGQSLALQSGMSLSVNIKIRDRTVMSLLSDLIIKHNDGLKTLR